MSLSKNFQFTVAVLGMSVRANGKYATRESGLDPCVCVKSAVCWWCLFGGGCHSPNQSYQPVNLVQS